MPDDHTGLLTGSHWGGIEVYDRPVFVTFSFPVSANAYVATLDDPAMTPAALASWQGFNAAEADMARAALQEWGDACGLTFIEVAPGQGDINFQKLDFSGTGYDGYGGIGYRPFGDWSGFSYPYFTGDLDSAGDVFLNSDITATYALMLHEIGHALGLKHPTEAWTQYAADPDVVHAVWGADDPAATIMSEQTSLTYLSAIDIAAIQAIYGTGTEDGTQVESWAWDAENETLTQTGYAGGDIIRGVSVRDVIFGGDGFDRMYGLSGDDTLYGGDGDDQLDGGAGRDRMTGGAGDDGYFVDHSGDRVKEAADAGWDMVYSTVSLTLGAHVEQLNLLTTGKARATGNDLSNVIFGGSGKTTITGFAGDDYLVGGAAQDRITGGVGSDLMFGGGAADRFVFADVADFGPDAAPDTIGDFSRAEKDKIDLSAIDPAQVWWLRDEFDRTVVRIDLDGDAVADHSILVYSETLLRVGDFIL